jgi:L-arabinokinase
MSPSYRIVFYVSGHGFGHASRAIEVIQAVLRSSPQARIVVKTAAPLRLFERTISGHCELIELQCDAGMVQIDSLTVDTAESIRNAVEFQKRMPTLVAIEAAYLRHTGARVAVGDIPPLAIAAAHSAAIPSVAIGNFTWDWIYGDYLYDGAPELAADLRALYRHATSVLRLPMAGGFAGLEAVTRDIGFIARRSQHTQDHVRAALGLPPRAEGKPLVLMSFGGYGVAGLDMAALGRLKDYTIAITDVRMSGNRMTTASELLYVPEQQIYDKGLRYEDLVRAADVVVTKPGYGIISEAIANDTSLLYTSRGHFVEYDVLVREMPRYLRVQFIEQDDLLSGNWSTALHKLMHLPAAPVRPLVNGAEVAAGEILRRLTQEE